MMQVRNQWRARPVQKAFVEAAQALATPTGQEQDRAGQGGKNRWHDGSCGQ